jgi:hypothetical protein
MSEQPGGKHEWFEYHGLTCCKHCGLVRRRDGGNDDKACKGIVRVALRAPAGADSLPIYGMREVK